jgi:O-antigen/teichoic acid export membrane protein
MENMTEKALSSKIKEAGSHSIIYGLGSALQSLLGFIFIPLYTRHYTTDMYGVLALLTLCGMLAGSVFYLGISSALARSYYDYKEGYERKKVISTSLFLTISGASAQILFGFLLKDQISGLLFNNKDYSVHIAIILSSSALLFVNGLFYMLLRFERKSRQVIAINLLFLILSASLILLFLIKLKLGVMAPILGEFISQIVLFCVLLYLSKNSLVPAFSVYEMKIQLQYGIPNILTGLALYLLTRSDRLFINKFCSISDVGIYSLGYQIGSVIHSLFIIPFGRAWEPMKMEYRNDKNANDLFRLMLTYYFIMGLFMAVGISLFSRELISLITGRQEYYAAYRVIPFIIIGHLLYGASCIIDNGIVFERRVIYHAYIFWLSLIVNATLNYFFIPLFGYMAAAISGLITFIILILIVFCVSNRLYKILFEGRRLLKLFSSGLLVLAVGSMISFDNIITLLVKALLIVILMVVWYLIVLNKNEKDRIYDFIR